MEGEAVELQGWEILQESGESALVSGSFEGVIKSDYFTIDNNPKNVGEAEVIDQESSVEFDNPSWIDPGSDEIPHMRKNSGEFWSYSGSDDRKLSGFDVGLAEFMKSDEGFGDMEAEEKKIGDLVSPRESKFIDLNVMEEMGIPENSKRQVDVEQSAETKLFDNKLNADVSEDDLGYSVDAKTGDTSEVSNLDVGINFGESEAVESSVGSETSAVAKFESDFNSGGEGEKKRIVWWKVPFEVMRYCVFRINPVWSFSMAAAVMGFIILGRSLYKMKRKSQSLQLKVTVDNKVSHFISRAARLNEAFSVVRRVPVIRPSLPAAGVTPWPVMSLR